MLTPRLLVCLFAAGIVFLSKFSVQSRELPGSISSYQTNAICSRNKEVENVDNLYHFKSGDRIVFKTAWDPCMAREDPFYVDPIPEGAKGTVLDVNTKYIRVKMDDSERWPKPILLWDDRRYNDGVQGGLSNIGKLANP